MEVTVGGLKKNNGVVVVSFSTVIGSAFAIWEGAAPRVGESHDVELEINEEFVWGENAVVSDGPYSLEVRGGETLLSARLISIDEYGVGVIDIDGAKTMIELAGFALQPPIFIRLNFEHLRLYPTRL